MQAFITAFVGAVALLSTLSAPQIVTPKNEKPHDHPATKLFITEYQWLVGTMVGYCAAWAVAVAERYEGLREGEPSLSEWKETAEELNVDRLNGGASLDSLIKYYEKRQYSLTFAELVPDSCDTQYAVAKALDDKCVAMLFMFEKGVGGHVETILGSQQCTLHVNSWGTEARVSLVGGYNHSNMEMFTENATSFVMMACPVQ